MDSERMARHVREQAEACGRLGSPLYAFLLGRLADDVLAGGDSLRVLAGHEDDPGPSALALRLAGTVHRLALAGHAPGLAAHYPSCGGDGDAQAAWPAFLGVLRERRDEVRAGLASPPQTNEVGRAAALLGALLHVAGDLPVRLWEIGASAGLNLRADRFAYLAQDGGAWGPASSPVTLDGAWNRVPAAAPSSLDVVERVGGDLSPVDPATDAGALRLASYVWPDQLDRLARLRAAIGVAREHPARLVQAGAAELLAGLEPAEGTLTVVWHSVMWQYLDADERGRVTARLADLGSRAGVQSPLVHIAVELPRPSADRSFRATVVLTAWPGGQERVLGEAAPHGVPTHWRA